MSKGSNETCTKCGRDVVSHFPRGHRFSAKKDTSS